MKVYACIGDIIDSKKIINRQEFQRELKSLLDLCNEKFSKDIVSNLTLTLGDEFQGLFKHAQTVFLVMDIISLSLELDGYRVRFGFSYGEISTQINRELSIGADGESFWFARDAIDSVHQTHYSQKVNERFKSKYDTVNALANSVLEVQNVLRKAWTKTQKELVLTSILHSGYEKIDHDYLRKKLDISAQNLSNRSGAAALIPYINSRKELARYLEKVMLDG